MLNDILEFAATTLKDEGRLAMWMPTANDQEVKIPVPTHVLLEIVSSCVQTFSKCDFTHFLRPIVQFVIHSLLQTFSYGQAV
jgi:tRNA G10  N-methylase Trm11